MKSSSPQTRIACMVGFLVLAFIGLGYRLVDLQVMRHEPLKAEVQDKIQRTFVRQPRRGEIRDRGGNVLAQSIFVKTVCANPAMLGPYRSEVAKVLSPLLEMEQADLENKLQVRTRLNEKNQVVTNQYVVLRRKVKSETWEQIRQQMRELNLGVDEKKLPKKDRIFYSALHERAIFSDPIDDQMRVYPNQTLAAHILGFVAMDEQETLQGTVLEDSGRDGLEKTLNGLLTGTRGWRTTEIVRRHELVAARDQDVEAKPGRHAILTLDIGLQHIVEAELADGVQKYNPISATAIVVRPDTGEVLALANYPVFDPNRPGATPEESRRNRAIEDIYEPGSTFKIVAISAALNEGLVSLESKFDIEGGRIYFAGRPLKDDHPGGIMTVDEIVAKSSNIGTFKVAQLLGQDRLYDYVRNFGFGTPSGISLGGEVRGIVTPTKNWSKLSISRIPIGQGVAVTPLQMVMAMSAVANRGRLMQPMLVSRIVDEEEHVVFQNQPRLVRQVIREDTAQLMVSALRNVVSTNGTARRARMERFSVAGKTGTAQKPGKGGYVAGKYVASFVGFFPAENPELCMLVVLNEPKPDYYGGSTAVPLFHNIAERAAKYLAIKPDLAVADVGSPGGMAIFPARIGLPAH